MISGPILELAKVAKVVTEKKDYLLRARRTSDDEVGSMIDAFNEMLGTIQSRDAVAGRPTKSWRIQPGTGTESGGSNRSAGAGRRKRRRRRG
jgi:hypothetical protein